MRPALKHHITGQASNVLKKRMAARKHLAKHRELRSAPFQHRMEQEGQQIEAEHGRREILLAVAEVMLDMVAFGLQHVVVFVFNLPPSGSTEQRYVKFHRDPGSCPMQSQRSCPG